MNGYEKIKRRVINSVGLLTSLCARLQMWMHGIEFGSENIVRGKICVYNEGKIRIGSCNRINSAYWANPIGLGNCTSLKVSSQGYLSIGSHCAISNTAIVCTTSVRIDDYVMIGSGCKIWDTDFHPIEPKYRKYGNNEFTKKSAVHICSNAFIGGGTMVLKGVTIGENAVIGAGSIVTKNIPANEIWAGSPAVFIKNLKD
ncbi:hypothetical protein B5G28_08415 [Faecalibacterium sp. An77]|uniref:acyltransferase n=1 Tax=Faecalibacterium sp. An77 TaxID=1965655 RepID=UPI000B393CBD|nr:acyltransferase [Faecalibacterium sp. An77]OUN38705.1 hypothetical protein B5G28_08415 [Faecalibacterium sp. An77]